MRCLLVLVALGVVVMYVSPVSAQRLEKQYCDCPDVLEPVCGRNSRTYPNECTLACSKTLKAYDGQCVRKAAFLRRL